MADSKATINTKLEKILQQMFTIPLKEQETDKYKALQKQVDTLTGQLAALEKKSTKTTPAPPPSKKAAPEENKPVKSIAVTIEGLESELKKLKKIEKPSEKQKQRKRAIYARLLKIGTSVKGATDRQKAAAKTAGAINPPKQTTVPEPVARTRVTGELVGSGKRDVDDFKGAGGPKSPNIFAPKKPAPEKKPAKTGSAATKADPSSAQYAAAIKAKAKKAEQKRKAERKGLEEMEEGIRVGELRSEKGRKKFKSPKDYQVGYRDFGSKDAPGTKVNISSADKDVTQKVAKRAVNEVFEGTTGKFGTIAGKKAIKGFFSDVLGIDDITVTYDAPGQGDDQRESYGKKRGGKVTAKRSSTKKAAAKRPTTKKYAMNRGGMASVRKPTRA